MTSPPFRWLAMLSLVACWGCTTTSVVRPQQLERLDGFGISGPNAPDPELETLSGGKVPVGRDARLFLDLPGTRVGGQFDAIRVQGGFFNGRLADGTLVQAPLAQVDRATVEHTNRDGAVAAAVVGGILFAGLGAVLLFMGMPHTTAVNGRPLRIRGQVVTAAAAASDGWSGGGPAPDTRALSPPARRALATAWLDTARAEHAAVPAFSRLSLTLMSLSAPSRLVEAAHRAALEEIEHARLAFALAGAYADEPASPGALVDLRGAPAVTATSLAELAQESLVDGCLNEGISAEVAREAAAHAGDPVIRAALETIARDESSHAELAWQIVAWCCAESGDELGRTLRKVVHRSRRWVAPTAVPEQVQDELVAHGWLGSPAWREIAERTQLAVASRLASLRLAPMRRG